MVCPEVLMYALTWLMLLTPACAQEAPAPSPPIDWGALELTALDGSELDPSKLRDKVVLVVNVSKGKKLKQFKGNIFRSAS